ncbi:dihydrolipoamide acetyltransferase family protein [Leifsonia naganoensis]|uniref:Dihydrolipoamide acetyltransferase component of pyruvate dehydrogenase complex n=1 Tax=Leifsonia naganoensis TaxID=150025 RepID=A0A853DVW9_9MICO|nr:dihydrolipoamide acetyltransferase family protein [Leifsonia naganoensis]NYK10065.1 pyruvate dehydrogenase E2 component (dihydrolipoamide acetyltransferase) [Leifsonia naganoensis]
MIDILMPRLSDTMTEGAIAAWHKKPGDAVAPGDVLVEIETDKALMEQEAYEAGVLAEILVAEGENVAIGTPIARLDDESGEGTPVVAAASTSAPAPASASPDRRPASPLVRKIARERGLDLAAIPGTGPGGRIVRADLDTVAGAPAVEPVRTQEQPPADAAADRVPFDGIRRAIAARLTESATTVPTFTATASADVGALLALRAELNAAVGDDARISVNDLLVRAVALALREHPGVNASYSAEDGGATLLHRRVNVGIAVASPAGLVVPVVPDADRASVSTISGIARALVAKAADRTLSAAEMAEGTFTVSNLGMYGVEHFTAIINPPQGAILAVGAGRDELALVDGEIVSRTRMRLTITADHRIIDGALAARFLATLVSLLEHPLRVIA